MPVGGQPGNSNAAKSKAFYRRLVAACEREDYKRVSESVEQILNKASSGEEWAIVMLRDTLDGKPKQQTEITGEDGGPIYIKTGIDRLLTEATKGAGD